LQDNSGQYVQHTLDSWNEWHRNGDGGVTYGVGTGHRSSENATEVGTGGGDEEGAGGTRSPPSPVSLPGSRRRWGGAGGIAHAGNK